MKVLSSFFFSNSPPPLAAPVLRMRHFRIRRDGLYREWSGIRSHKYRCPSFSTVLWTSRKWVINVLEYRLRGIDGCQKWLTKHMGMLMCPSSTCEKVRRVRFLGAVSGTHKRTGPSGCSQMRVPFADVSSRQK